MLTLSLDLVSPPSHLPAIALLVQPANLIHAEILAVTSAMRKNQRWASTSYAARSYTTAAGHLGMGGVAGGSRIRSRENDEGRGRVHTATTLMSGFMELNMRLRDLEGNFLRFLSETSSRTVDR